MINLSIHVRRIFQPSKCHFEYNRSFFSPEIHFIEGSFNVYYYTVAKSTGFSIGVASAPTPTGPYKDIGKPLLGDNGEDVYYPNIANDGEYNREIN